MFNNYNRQDYEEKTVIKCKKCPQKLRVPVDTGKIMVTCPICKTEFIFDPNSLAFKTSSFVKNIFYSWKRNISAMKRSVTALNNMLRSMNGGRYKRR